MRDGFVSIDTFFAKDHPLTSYQLRVTLYRTPSTTAKPRLRLVGAVASDAPNQKPSIPTPLGGAEGITLAVPQYSQEIHAGQYPEYDGGGEAWCSPTSTVDGARATGARCRPPSEWSWVDPVLRRSVGGQHRPPGVRRPLRRRRQLAVQHGVRGRTRPERVRDPAARPERGRAVHQGGDPARRLGGCEPEQADRVPARQGHEWPPARDRRLHGDRATSWSTTRRRRAMRRCSGCTTGPSSSGPGCPPPAGSST